MSRQAEINTLIDRFIGVELYDGDMAENAAYETQALADSLQRNGEAGSRTAALAIAIRRIRDRFDETAGMTTEQRAEEQAERMVEDTERTVAEAPPETNRAADEAEGRPDREEDLGMQFLRAFGRPTDDPVIWEIETTVGWQKVRAIQSPEGRTNIFTSEDLPRPARNELRNEHNRIRAFTTTRASNEAEAEESAADGEEQVGGTLTGIEEQPLRVRQADLERNPRDVASEDISRYFQEFMASRRQTIPRARPIGTGGRRPLWQGGHRPERAGEGESGMMQGFIKGMNITVTSEPNELPGDIESLVGFSGVVSDIRSEPAEDCVLVKFDENIGGHDGEGRGPRGHYWWIYGRYLSSSDGSRFVISKKLEYKGSELKGKKIRILKTVKRRNEYLVEFEEDIGGHAADGLGKRGHCLTIKTDMVEQKKGKK